MMIVELIEKNVYLKMLRNVFNPINKNIVSISIRMSIVFRSARK